MDKNTAEMVVKVFAILSWIGAAFSVFAAIGMLFLAGSGGMMGMMGGLDASILGGMMGGLGIILAVVFIALAVLYVFVGLGLWRHREWSRIATIVLSVLSLFSFPIGTIIGALGIWLFGFEPTVKKLFK